MSTLPRDDDFIPVAGAVTDNAAATVVPWKVDPTTGRLLISAVLANGGTGTWYDVTGTIDGSNKTFTIPVAPASDILLFLARQPQMKTTDFTLATSTITYASAPDSSLSGQPHKVFVIS